MIKNYIEKIYSELIPNNDGYRYLCTTDIYIPFYKVDLCITKRKFIPLNLVEEMVLKLIEQKLNSIDDIAGVLGLDKELLNITISDLYSKDLLYQSANRCSLLKKGRQALKELNSTKLEEDTLRNIYINPISKEITQHRNENIVNNCQFPNQKVTYSLFNAKDIDFYRSNISIFKNIFQEQISSYSGDGQVQVDELVSLNEIEDVFVCFYKIAVHIYVSENGTDIDLLPKNKSTSEVLESSKDVIIEKIRQYKLLNNVFNRYRKPDFEIPEIEFESAEIMKTLIKSISYNDYQINESEIYNVILTNRILLNNELSIIFQEVFTKKESLIVSIDNLDYWSKDSQFIYLLSIFSTYKSLEIHYSNVGNLSASLKRLKNSCPSIIKETFVENAHTNWLQIEIANHTKVIGIPKSLSVLDSNTYATTKTFYLITTEADI